MTPVALLGLSLIHILRCLNIKPEIMSQFMQELTGSEEVPLFASPVLRGDELSGSLLRELHQMIMQEREDMAKEETFYFLLEQLVAAGISKTSIEAKAPPVRRVTAVSYTHLDVYKRQNLYH